MVLCILILIFVKFESQCSIVLEAAVHFIEDSVMMGWAGIWRNTIYVTTIFINSKLGFINITSSLTYIG